MFGEKLVAEELSKIGNPLDAISKVVDFEIFREPLERGLLNSNKKNNAGARPFDVVMMFKIMLLQRYYSLSDKQAEYQILDRSSFKKFLGLDSADKVPDEKTIAEKQMINRVHEKGYRNKPLTEEQKESNRGKSKIRARVEHVFASMEQSMKELCVTAVGKIRANGIIGLINLTYNLFRYEQLVRLGVK